MTDPLHALSGSYVEQDVVGPLGPQQPMRELTFAELSEHCKREIALYDSLTPQQREVVQRHMDPHYGKKPRVIQTIRRRRR